MSNFMALVLQERLNAGLGTNLSHRLMAHFSRLLWYLALYPHRCAPSTPRHFDIDHSQRSPVLLVWHLELVILVLGWDLVFWVV